MLASLSITAMGEYLRATAAQLECISEAESRAGVAGFFSKENWKNDADASACTSPCCASGSVPGAPLVFGFFKRRHHCRRCGEIFCNACSSGRVVIADSGPEKPHRVCDACATSLVSILARVPAQPRDAREQPPQVAAAPCVAAVAATRTSEQRAKPDSSSTAMKFEECGVSMALIKVFGEAAEDFRLVPRFLLAGGDTAVGLEPPPAGDELPPAGSPEPAPEPTGPAQPEPADRQVAVQVRGVDAGRTAVTRRPGRVPMSAIVRQLKAAVGDRVLVMPPPPPPPNPSAVCTPPPADPNEFEPLAIDQAASDEEKQAALFRWIDRDGDGVLSRAEYGRYLILLGNGKLTDEEWARQFADLYKADPAVGITAPQYVASYGHKDKMPLEKELEVVRRQLALFAAGSIDLRFKWTRWTHNNCAIYRDGEAEALSLVAPAEGVCSEQD